MKTIKYTLATLMVAAIVAVVFVGCKKEKDDKHETKSAQIISHEEGEKGIGIPFSWKWHRKKHECKRGFGICDFVIGKPKPTPSYQSFDFEEEGMNTAYIQNDGKGGCFVDLLLAGNEDFDDTQKNLYVDEDIVEFGPDGSVYFVKQGIYPINLKLGIFGGYRIPIEINSSLTDK